MVGALRRHPPPADDQPCLCRICICGQHECPGVPEPISLGANSSYREDYCPKHLAERAKPFKGSSQVLSSIAAPGHFMTTNQAAQEAGKGCPFDRAISCKPTTGSVQHLPFSGNSIYREDYPGHKPTAQGRVHPPAEALQRAPFVPGAFETTSQAAANDVLKALKDGTLERPHPCKKDSLVHHQNLPFTAQSSYQEAYKGPKPTSVPRHRVVPDSLNPSTENRDFLTTASAAYKKPPVERRRQCPSTFIPPKPPAPDGHVKLDEIPDEFGNFTPAKNYTPPRNRPTAFSVN